SFSNEVLTYLLEANSNSGGAIKALPVKAPWIGSKVRLAYYEDLHMLSGATPIKGESVNELSIDHVGQVDVTATPSSVLLSNGRAHPNKEQRLKDLRNELKNVENSKKRELQDRISLYTGKSSKLTVGGKTLSDLNETFIR